MSNPVKGNSINLFIKEGEHYYRIAHSTVFTLNTNTKTSKTISKDYDNVFYGLRIANVGWSIEGESLVIDADTDLFDKMISQEKLKICYGIVAEGQPTPPQEGYIGYCYITDLELEANTGDKAMYRYSLTGCSPLEYGDIDDPDAEDPIDFINRTTPQLAFSAAGGVCNEGDDPDLGTLINPNNLTVRFTITKID